MIRLGVVVAGEVRTGSWGFKRRVPQRLDMREIQRKMPKSRKDLERFGESEPGGGGGGGERDAEND